MRKTVIIFGVTMIILAALTFRFQSETYRTMDNVPCQRLSEYGDSSVIKGLKIDFWFRDWSGGLRWDCRLDFPQGDPEIKAAFSIAAAETAKSDEQEAGVCENDEVRATITPNHITVIDKKNQSVLIDADIVETADNYYYQSNIQNAWHSANRILYREGRLYLVWLHIETVMIEVFDNSGLSYGTDVELMRFGVKYKFVDEGLAVTF
ncbi:MAG: hypothetical protein II704_03205 [Erysipelotrichaceae bacterium]|nr:hypothetical protein [Erysipelotrichaceae bacterium]